MAEALAPVGVDGVVENDVEKQMIKCAAAHKNSHPPLVLAWRNLTVTAKNVKGQDKVILNGISGCVPPCAMLAIMGPSGCGKTTLLDTLAGRQPGSVRVDGEVLLNGHASNLSYGRSAYVTQDEVLVGTLSVREVLQYTAKLRLPRSMSSAEKMQIVEETMQELGLMVAADTKIGNWFIKGISGGQRRRVAIGCELVTSPTLLFLDEPTSGLDSAAAYYVMNTIRKLAEHGRTVLSVIHQPSSEVFDLFDRLCLLSFGNVIYMGKASEALDMFDAAGLPCPARRNPTDHFLHVINKDFKAEDHDEDTIEEQIKKLQDTYEATVHPTVLRNLEASTAKGEKYEGELRREMTPNFFYQSWVLTCRMFVNNTRNIGVFWLRLAMYIMLCICMGTVYLDMGTSWVDTYSITAMLFFIVAFLTFMSIAGFPAFVEDMSVFIRERLNGYYNIITFVIANTLASAPFIFLIAVVCSLIVYWLVGLNDDGDRFVYFFLNLYTALTVVESLMMAIAAIVPHYLMGIAAGAGILGMFMLVCGFFQPVSQLPDPVWRYPMHYLSFHAYAFGGFMQNQFAGTSGWDCPCSAQPGGCGPPYTVDNPCEYSGDDILDYWVSGVGTLNKWASLGIQWFMSLVYRAIFYGMLLLKERMQRG